MELFDFIKNDRDGRCMTQLEYSKLLKINRTTLAYLETGRTPSAATAKKLVSFFGKPLSELLGNSKLDRMANLETTSMLIDSMIENGRITGVDLTADVNSDILESIRLEIALKIALYKKKEDN